MSKRIFIGSHLKVLYDFVKFKSKVGDKEVSDIREKMIFLSQITKTSIGSLIDIINNDKEVPKKVQEHLKTSLVDGPAFKLPT